MRSHKITKRRVKVGDIFDIPLSGGRKAFGQYAFADRKVGPIIQVFDLIVAKDDDVDLDMVVKRPLRFSPIITGVFAAVKKGMWRIIGNSPVSDFVYPKFVSTFWDEKTGKAGIWFLWDGNKDTRVGATLPKEYKGLEYLIVWDPHDVVARIETGVYPFPYKDLIEKNRFEPLTG